MIVVLRTHLAITREEHWLISALLRRFPKEKCALHTPDEVNDARKVSPIPVGEMVWRSRRAAHSR